MQANEEISCEMPRNEIEIVVFGTSWSLAFAIAWRTSSRSASLRPSMASTLGPSRTPSAACLGMMTKNSQADRMTMMPAHTSGAIHNERCSQNSRRTSSSMVFMRPPSGRRRTDFPQGSELLAFATVEQHRGAPEYITFLQGLECARPLDISGRRHELG